MNNTMAEPRTAAARRITREIEDAVTHNYPGEGLWGVLAPGYALGTMCIELPYGMQWKQLNERVNWSGLTTAEKDQVMAKALEDVREKVPEEIYPATWFNNIIISAYQNSKVFDLAQVKKQIDTPGRAQNLDERVCAPERIEEHLREMDRPVASPSLE